LLFGLIICCHEKITSSAVNGAPSCHVTPDAGGRRSRAVAADVAVLLTWDARREFGNELVAVAPVEEPAAPELREVVVDRLGS